MDSDDLNSFCSSLSQHGLAYDINADGVYDTTDYVEILSSSFGTLPGDIDLNGVFDSTDLVSLFQVGNYETGASGLRWTDGDFNCDGQVNSTDIVDAFIAGLYEVPAAENETEVETVAVASRSHPTQFRPRSEICDTYNRPGQIRKLRSYRQQI